MGRTPRWNEQPMLEGTGGIITLSSWKYFSDYITQKLLDYRAYVFRGQSCSRWKLESTLDRELRGTPLTTRDTAREQHLENFKYAVRGRRGNNPSELVTDNDWWALGQHNGLATPLLDFTESPFVALYFAFHDVPTDGDDHRAVWAMWRHSAKPDKANSGTECELVRPLTDENSRLVSQRGLFVRVPDGQSIETWIKEKYEGEMKMHLINIRIPNKERTRCLRWLNRTNINHLSLFPDLYGASLYCNTDLKIRNY